jgi:uncharacterized protein YjbI with pentapeptide repeats
LGLLLLAVASLLLVSPTSAQSALASPAGADVVASQASCLTLLPGADLRHCDFAYRALRGVDLAGADLRGVNFAFADLSEAHLQGARLEGAHLVSATLRGADLRQASLYSADLRLADLRGADLTGADASQAELSNAAIDLGTLAYVRLTGSVAPEGTLCNDASCPVLHVAPTRVAVWEP